MTTAQWPTAHSPRCQHCGGHVTDRFRRVYGDDENVAHRCWDCDSRVRLAAGSAAGLDVDVPDPEQQPERQPNSAAGWS